MSKKIKIIKEKESRIKEIKEKQRDESGLEEDIHQSQEEQITEFASSTQPITPVLETGQEIPQQLPTISQISEDNLNQTSPEETTEPPYRTMDEEMQATRTASSSAEISPILRQKSGIGNRNELFGNQRGELAEFGTREGRAKYSEKIQIEHKKVERKMPWEV